MTTIATDGHTVAADGWRLWGSDIVARSEKKLRQRYGRVYALTGLAPIFDALIEWHNKGADVEGTPKIKDDETWVLVVIDHAGITKYSSSCAYPEKFDPPFAVGAGLDLALGVMLNGGSPKRAIEIVAARCNHTGGEIQVIDIAEALGLKDEVREAAE